MKIVIVGATGKIGKQVTIQALNQGHSVTAFARSPNKLQEFDGQINIVQGNVLEATSLHEAIDGQDAVICTLGMPLMNNDGLRAKGTENIISVMESTQVNRLICLSSLGAGDSRSSLPALYRYLLVPLLMKRLFADHEQQEAYVKASNLDWSIIRSASFSKGINTGVYWHGNDATNCQLTFKISHADVAQFILKQLGNRAYFRQTPGISYASST